MASSAFHQRAPAVRIHQSKIARLCCSSRERCATNLAAELGLRGAGAKQILVRLLLESAPHEQRDSLVRHPLSSACGAVSSHRRVDQEWQPRAPITEMWIELPVLEAAGRRQAAAVGGRRWKTAKKWSPRSSDAGTVG